MAKTQPTEQDDVVNAERGPVLAPPSTLMVDALVKVAYDALGANRMMTAQDQQGRLWLFTPDNREGLTTLRIAATWPSPTAGVIDLGQNRLLTSLLQSEGGDAMLRSAIAIIAGGSAREAAKETRSFRR